jgi:hypothetical protein
MDLVLVLALNKLGISQMIVYDVSSMYDVEKVHSFLMAFSEFSCLHGPDIEMKPL